MKTCRISVLSTFLVILLASSALAAYSGDAPAIEMNSDDAPAQQQIDQALTTRLLDELLPQSHTKSALRAQAPMEGHYVSNGAETPQQFGQTSYLYETTQHQESAEPLLLSNSIEPLSGGHLVSMAGADSAPSQLPTPPSAVAGAATELSYTASDTTPVPLPPSSLLLLSGLLGLPVAAMGRSRNTCC